MILRGVALMLVMLLMSGCGSRVRKGYEDSVPGEIRSLINSKYANSLHAVGTSSGPEEAIAIDKAALQARAEIAREFKSQIDVLQKDYQEALHGQATGEYKQVMELFSRLELSGSKVVKSMVRKEKNDQYHAKVLVAVSAEQLKGIIDQKLRDYTSFKATRAYKELEKRVEKESRGSGEQ
ncbi:MAG: hypothetical protein GX556_18670 [Fibrobacter sp.]|nr:hypothetical protein [Fibrobacter sp.]